MVDIRGIPFTQYLLPDGRKRDQWISMPSEIESLAFKFIDSGGRYECEMLGDMQTISLTACMEVDGEEQDIACEVVQNGPEVVAAVERLVKSSVSYAGF